MNIFDIDENKNQHDKFKLLNEQFYYKNEREKLIELSKGFFDRDGNIAVELQTKFHPAFWEIYVHALLKDMSFKVNDKYNRPDFIVESPEKMYIEAVVSNIRIDGEPEALRTPEDVQNNLKGFESDSDFSNFINESIIRNSSAISSKIKKYQKEYVDLDWVSKELPYVIALSSYNQINYGKECIFSMFALLYGHYFSPEKDMFEIKDHVIKTGQNGEVNIPLGIFKDEKFSEISAIIFSPTTTLGKLSALCKSEGDTSAFVMNIRYNHGGNYLTHIVSPEHPESIYDGVYIFHNPLAKNKIKNKDVFNEKIIQFSLNDNDYLHIIQRNSLNLPIMARFCHPEILLNDYSKNELMVGAMASYNRKKIEEITKSPLSKKENKVVKKDKRRKPTKMEKKNRIKNKRKK